MAWTTEVIETERLRLRAFGEGDKPLIVELMSDPDVRGHLGGPMPREQAEAAVRDAVVGERFGVFCVAEGTTDVAIGRVSLDDHRGEWEIGYELATSAWGRGLAFEAVGAVIEWCWSNVATPSLIAVTQTANARSCRLLAALGFRLERGFEEFGEPQSQFRREASSSAM